jgi:hypothetical protein
MNRFLASQLFAMFLVAAPLCMGQTRMAISYPDLDQKDQVVHISYHIADSKPSDVGPEVHGGGEKQIAWDAGADSVSLADPIDIRILVKALTPTRRELLALEEAQLEKEAQVQMERENLVSGGVPGAAIQAQPQIQTFTRGGLVFRSLLYPGWGLSVVERKPHWIKGLAAYSCVAGSVVLNRKAIKSYGQIADFEDYPSKDERYQKAVMQDNFSEILAYTAAGIWLADFVWTLIGTRGIQTFEVHPKMDPLSHAPMIGLTYRF